METHINQTFLFKVLCLRFHVYFQGCTPQKKKNETEISSFPPCICTPSSPHMSAVLVRVPSGKAFGMLMLPGEVGTEIPQRTSAFVCSLGWVWEKMPDSLLFSNGTTYYWIWLARGKYKIYSFDVWCSFENNLEFLFCKIPKLHTRYDHPKKLMCVHHCISPGNMQVNVFYLAFSRLICRPLSWHISS